MSRNIYMITPLLRSRLTIASFREDLQVLGLIGHSPLIVCVSGGIDSMTLWHLVRELGIRHIVAHLNYGLRGRDSDRDERLVERTAKSADVHLHIRRPGSVAPDGASSTGVQRRARDARIAFATELSAEFDSAPVLLGHHANDHAETVLMNLARGTGGLGLAGIPEHTSPFFRPLLRYGRGVIEDYAEEHGVVYREDTSNASYTYTRNRFRHHVLPALLFADERALSGIARSASHQRSLVDFAEGAAASLLHAAEIQSFSPNLKPSIERFSHEDEVAEKVGEQPQYLTRYSRTRLSETRGLSTLLKFWLAPIGYRSAQVLTLAHWIGDGLLERRMLQSPDLREAVIVTGSSVFRKRLTHDS